MTVREKKDTAFETLLAVSEKVMQKARYYQNEMADRICKGLDSKEQYNKGIALLDFCSEISEMMNECL